MSQSRVLSTEAELREEFEIIEVAKTTEKGLRFLTVEYDDLIAFHYMSEGVDKDKVIVLNSILVYYSIGAFNNKIGYIKDNYYQKSTYEWFDYRFEKPILIQKRKVDDRYMIGYIIVIDEDEKE